MKLSLKNQKGFGLLEVLLIIIAISIIGFGGYYVYTNQSKGDKELTSADDTKQRAAQDDVITERTYELVVGSSKIVVTHPSDWKYVDNDEDDYYDSDGYLLGPGGDVAISLRGQNESGGLGGECIPEENGRIIDVERFETQEPGFYAIKEIDRDLDGTYGYSAYVSQSPSITSLRAGDSICEMVFTGFLLRDYDEGYGLVGINSLRLQDKSAHSAALSESEIRDFFDSADFKTAIEILKTLEVKTRR